MDVVSDQKDTRSQFPVGRLVLSLNTRRELIHEKCWLPFSPSHSRCSKAFHLPSPKPPNAFSSRVQRICSLFFNIYTPSLAKLSLAKFSLGHWREGDEPSRQRCFLVKYSPSSALFKIVASCSTVPLYQNLSQFPINNGN